MGLKENNLKNGTFKISAHQVKLEVFEAFVNKRHTPASTFSSALSSVGFSSSEVTKCERHAQ